MNDEMLRAAKDVIARNVVAIRTAKGITQADLARDAGLVRQKISQIENSVENLTLATLTKVAAALGVTLADLVRE